jgi:hypothetical protein
MITGMLANEVTDDVGIEEGASTGQDYGNAPIEKEGGASS